MAVAHDAVTMGGEFTGASPHTVNHTPVGTPKGVLVFISQGGTAAGNDTITGVTYGGTAMTRVATNGWAADTAGEAGSTFAYFLGSSVPTGAQDCVVSTNGGSALKWVYVITLTGAANLEVVVSGRVQGDTADPSVTLDSGVTSTLRYGCIYSGHAAPTSLVTVLSAVGEHDFGNYVTRCDRQTLPGGGSSSVGYTALLDDVAMIGVAIGEAAGGLSATIAQSSGTNTAQAVGRLRTAAVGQASGSNTALALAAAIHKATIGQAVGTSSALAAGSVSTQTIGQAIDTGSALALPRTIARATETNSAQSVTGARALAVGQATDTASALPLAALSTQTIGQAASTDTASALTASSVTAIGQATEASTAGAMSTPGGVTISQAADTSTARPLGALSTLTITQASSTDEALPASTTRARTIAQATETSTARPLSSTKVAAVGMATDTSTALPALRLRALTINQASSTDTAQPVSTLKLGSILAATDTGAALPVSRTGYQVAEIGRAAEQNLALDLDAVTFGYGGGSTFTYGPSGETASYGTDGQFTYRE